MFCCVIVFIFFFKQKTAYEMRISDWSSDVCSSDLLYPHQTMGEIRNCPNGTAECNNQLCPSLRQCSLRQITAQRTLRLRQELRADSAVPTATKQNCLMSKSWTRQARFSMRWALAEPRSSGSILNQERDRKRKH